MVVLNQYIFVHFISQAGVEVVVLNQYIFVHFRSQAGVEVVVLNQYMLYTSDPKQVLKWCLGSTVVGTQYGAVCSLSFNKDCTRLLCGFAKGQVRYIVIKAF